jgi:hypothetical protein
MRRHWELDKGEYRLDPFEEFVYRQYEPSDLSSITVDDEASVVSKFRKHTEEVLAFFHDKSDRLLVVDLEDSQINERISDFLDLEVRPYPHESRY